MWQIECSIESRSRYLVILRIEWDQLCITVSNSSPDLLELIIEYKYLISAQWPINIIYDYMIKNPSKSSNWKNNKFDRKLLYSVFFLLTICVGQYANIFLLIFNIKGLIMTTLPLLLIIILFVNSCMGCVIPSMRSCRGCDIPLWVVVWGVWCPPPPSITLTASSMDGPVSHTYSCCIGMVL